MKDFSALHSPEISQAILQVACEKKLYWTGGIREDCPVIT